MKDWFAHNVLGLPELASSNGHAVDDLMVYVHWLMLALFVGWIIYFGYVLFRFNVARNKTASYEGSKARCPPAWNSPSSPSKLFAAAGHRCAAVGEKRDSFPKPEDATVMQIMAQQFAWNARYPGLDGKFGRQDMKLIASDNVFGVDPADPPARTTCRCSMKSTCPSTSRADLFEFQGRDPFAQARGHASHAGRDSRPAYSLHLHAQRKSAATRSNARSSAAAVTPRWPAALSSCKARPTSTPG
jgi:heme/copper-type cytochrome/quinol oxidase subunit 2